jgi:hypothetical protein
MEIKNRFSGEVIIAGDAATLADLVATARRKGKSLSGADLSRANLSGANLSLADLSLARGVQPERCTPLLLLLDQPAAIRAYKLVTAEGDSPMCRSNGHTPIHYEIGQAYEVADACTDVGQDCAAGISLATLDWVLANHQEGHRVFIAEFEAKDIAAIPTASNGKIRVKRCRIVAEKDISALVKKPEPEKPAEAPAAVAPPEPPPREAEASEEARQAGAEGEVTV